MEKKVEKNYITMKVFDCQDMPKDVREVFFKTCGSPSFRGGNDCLVETHCYMERMPIELIRTPRYKVTLHTPNGNEIIYDKTEGGIRYIIEKGHDIVSDWLFDNGAKIWEPVVIKHWW